MAAKRDVSRANDAVDESVQSSPVKEQSFHVSNQHTLNKSAQSNVRADATAKEAHDDELRQELARVRKVNEVIEGVIQGLEKAKSNMKNVNQTVGSASSLLNIWTRILSQTEHNQRLILNPSWHGASQDIADMEEEAISQRKAAERREAEEQERQTAAAAKKADEGDRRQLDMTTAKPKPVIRGRTGIGRGSSATKTGNTSTGSTNTSTTSTSRGTTSRRTTGGLSRGTRGTRARG